MITQDRVSGTGGGVAILLNKNLAHSVININRVDGIEFCAVKLRHPKFYVGVAYVPPSTTLSPSHLDKLISIGSPFVIGGDFNAKHRHWNNSRANHSGKTLYHHFSNNNYDVIFPNHFARLAPGVSPSTLDIFLIDSDLSFICDTRDLGPSDHSPVVLAASTESPSRGIDVEIDWEKYRSLTGNFNMRSAFAGPRDIDDVNRSMVTLMHSARRTVTLKIDTARTRHAFLQNDPYLLSLIRKRTHLRKHAQRFGSSFLHPFARDLIASIKRQISYLTHKDWINKLSSFKKPNPTFWPVYKILAGKSTSTPLPVLSKGGQPISSAPEKAEILADQFESVYIEASAASSPLQSTVNDFITEFSRNQTPSPTS
nr:PREDICTED: RNA-directed DNA polymerase from mobile element jockey-like [Megachile rotundata]